jgi:hypothetical protein
MENEGLEKEKEIIYFLNGKRYGELPKGLQQLLKALFQDPESEPLKAFQMPPKMKADCCLSIGEEKRFLSIKTGNGNSIHEENLATLVPFFREQGLNQHLLKTLVYYHYGDGTLNGHGEFRQTARELWHTFPKELAELVHALSEEKILRACFSRFAFEGRTGIGKVDAIYVGDTHDGVFATRQEIEKFIPHFRTPLTERGLCFGPLSYQPHSRNLSGLGYEEQFRDCAEIKWRSLDLDLGEIRKRVLLSKPPFGDNKIGASKPLRQRK